MSEQGNGKAPAGHPHWIEDCWVSDLKVMRSAAGHYIGRSCVDPEMGGGAMPYSRESGYFGSYEDAEVQLAEGFGLRQCVENDAAYDAGALPDLRGGPSVH